MRYYFKINKKISKRSKVLIFAVLIVVFIFSFGTLAAYVSRSYVKGVATTPKQEFTLSSDYLSVVPKNEEANLFPDKKILLTEKDEADDTPYTFSFSITNTSDGTVSLKRIQYYLKMSNLPDGTIVKYGERVITSEVTSDSGYKAHVMAAFTKVTHTYTVIIPKDKMTSAADIIVTATPDADSDTSGYMLAGRLQPSIKGTIAAFSYEGRFIDEGNIRDYAAFNYQISVYNAEDDHEMILTWNKDLIEIDPLFLRKINNTDGNSGMLTLTMNNADNNYMIQFYRLTGDSINSWEDLQIDFKPAE